MMVEESHLCCYTKNVMLVTDFVNGYRYVYYYSFKQDLTQINCLGLSLSLSSLVHLYTSYLTALSAQLFQYRKCNNNN